MARRKKHEEHANHEAWAIPYADLMTLLLAFFVVMYAISTVNEGKYRVVADALTAAFGGAPRTINPVQVGNHQLQGADFDRPSPIKSGAKEGPSAPSPSPNVTLLAAMASQMNMSLLICTSSHSVERLMVTSFSSISGASARSRSSAMRLSSPCAACSPLASSDMFICEAIAASRVTLGEGEGAEGPFLAPDLIGEGRSKSAPCS